MDVWSEQQSKQLVPGGLSDPGSHSKKSTDPARHCTGWADQKRGYLSFHAFHTVFTLIAASQSPQQIFCSGL